MSDKSDISIENPAAGGSPTDNTMMRRVTGKAATSSLFSERVENTSGNFFPLTMGMKSTPKKILEKLMTLGLK